MFIWLVAIAAISYLVAGVNGAILTAHLMYHKDIRNYGSGNPGLTNFYRTFGKNAVILVILIDILKAVVPVLIGGFIAAETGAWGSYEDRVLLGRVLAGFFAILAHCFPIYYKFKGGKGVLTGGTVSILVDWRVALIVIGLFVICVALTRFVSLGSVMAGVGYPISMILVGNRQWWAILLTLLSGGLIIWRHKDNIKRLVKGEERKFSFRRSPENK